MALFTTAVAIAGDFLDVAHRLGYRMTGDDFIPMAVWQPRMPGRPPSLCPTTTMDRTIVFNWHGIPKASSSSAHLRYTLTLVYSARGFSCVLRRLETRSS